MYYRFIVIGLLMTVPQSCAVFRKMNLPKEESETPTTSKRTLSATQRKTANGAIGTARRYIGTPYKYGGTSGDGMDCSGLVLKAYAAAGVELPRTSVAMSKFGTFIPSADIQIGDLLFFATGGGNRVSHVGLVSQVTNSGQRQLKFIHASTEFGVREENFDTPYYQKTFLHAMRPTQ